jgi:hypothetical protein
MSYQDSFGGNPVRIKSVPEQAIVRPPNTVDHTGN